MKSRDTALVILLAACTVSCSSALCADEQETVGVAPAETVKSLLEGKVVERLPESRPPTSPWILTLKLTASLVLVAAAGIVLVLLYRRMGARAFGGANGAVEIVGRTVLSPRHTIYLVRVDDRRLLAVGVSGERMTTLTELDEARETTSTWSLREGGAQHSPPVVGKAGE